MTLPAKATMIGAVTGVIVTGLLMAMTSQGSQVSTTALFILWPSSLFGFGYNGGSFWTSLIIGSLEFGGSAIQYGVAGFMIGWAVDYFTPTYSDDAVEHLEETHPPNERI